MARKRKPRAERSRAPSPGEIAPVKPAAPVEPPAPVDAPASWFGFDVPWAKLAIGRVALFGLLALDAVLQLAGAPQYSGFNVSHVPGLDALGPTRVVFGALELVDAYLFVLIACGLATRVLVPITASIYAWLYFGSQIDEYQHHYLVALILLLACFVPWQRPAGAVASTPVRSWAVRLMLVQLGIVYFWAAISKMDASWTNGATLAAEISGPLRGLLDDTIGLRAAAQGVIGVELALAASVWQPRAWRFAAPVGILLHLGFAFAGFRIGLFAWMMLGLYAFVVPDRIWVGLWNAVRVEGPRRDGGRPAAGRSRGWPVVAVALAVGSGLALLCRLESSLAVAAGLSVALVGITAWKRPPLREVAVAHVLALATWVTVDRTTKTAAEYDRNWGDSARRLHDLATAEHAYHKQIEVAPDDPEGHYYLGLTLLEGGRVEEGLEELHRVEANDASRARGLVAEAIWLGNNGRPAEAMAKAREAARVEPGNANALKVISMLGGDAKGSRGRSLE
jgi:hypothetical protein